MIQIVLAAVLWGLLGPVAYVALREGLSPLEIAFWRATLAVVPFGLHALLESRARIARRDLLAVGAFGVVGVSLFFGSYLIAIERAGAALAAVLLYTAPAWVAVLARAFLGERLTPRRLLALVATLTGVTLVATGAGAPGPIGRAHALGGIGWGLVAGWSYALYYLFGRRYFARYSAPAVFVLALPVGALGLLPFVSFSPKSSTAWVTLAVLALVPTYGAYLLYAAGLRRVQATRAATIATLEPVVAAAAAFLAFGERLTISGYLGAALVIAAVLIIVSERSGGEPRSDRGAPVAASGIRDRSTVDEPRTSSSSR